MENTYTWKVLNLETVPSINGLENAVAVIRWLITATDESNSTTVEGTVELDNPSSEGYIAYGDLNEEQVLTWAKSTLGDELVTKYYQYLDQQLVKLTKLTPVPAELPWV